MPEIPDDPKEAFLWFYEEYTKLKAANSPQTAIPAIGCMQRLQIVGGVGNEEKTLPRENQESLDHRLMLLARPFRA
jgi:hypothetical protein